MNSSMPGLPVHHQLLQFTQTLVHKVGEAIKPSHPLSSSLLLPSFFLSISVFLNESVLCIRWPKYWSFSFNISPSNEYSGLVGTPCRPRDSQESSPKQQFKTINSPVLSFLYSPTLTSVKSFNIISSQNWSIYIRKVLNITKYQWNRTQVKTRYHLSGCVL